MRAISVRLPEEAIAELDRRAERRGQSRGDWLRDQLTKALLRQEPAAQQAQASKRLERREVEPMPKGTWKAR